MCGGFKLDLPRFTTMRKLHLLVTTVSALTSSLGYSSSPKDSPGVGFRHLVETLQQSKAIDVSLARNGFSYTVLVHSPAVKTRLKPFYSEADLAELAAFLSPITEIRVDDRGLVKAADRDGAAGGASDPTHYDAVWLRDSLWAYLGLSGELELPAKNRRSPLRGLGSSNRVLLAMLDYVSTPDQLSRLRSVIKDPRILKLPDGDMKTVHIRFDGKSGKYDDVLIDGKPQAWNHKQNDALGLLFDLSLRAIASGSIDASALKPAHLEALALLPAYFSHVRFYEMEDAGSWEEIERVNSSSIGLVLSGLENFARILSSNEPSERRLAMLITHAGEKLALANDLTKVAITKLIDQGYERLFAQLNANGESPLYPRNSPRYRTSDAALLNLIYPARLSRLKRQDKDHILELIRPLVGRAGIKRYIGDSYQSGNFWFNAFETFERPQEDDVDSRSARDFAGREKQFIPGTEAQWFFDSWLSKAFGVMAAEYNDANLRQEQLRFF